MPRPSLSRDAAFSAGALVLVLLWEWGEQDLALASWFGSAQGFALHNSVWFDALLHRWPHHLAWFVLLAFAAQLRWPLPAFRALPRSSIAWGVGATLLVLLLIQ